MKGRHNALTLFLQSEHSQYFSHARSFEFLNLSSRARWSPLAPAAGVSLAITAGLVVDLDLPLPISHSPCWRPGGAGGGSSPSTFQMLLTPPLSRGLELLGLPALGGT